MAKQKSQHDFLRELITELMHIGKELRKSELPSMNLIAYNREKDEKGWWMAIKESAVMRYMSIYLKIIRDNFGLKR